MQKKQLGTLYVVATPIGNLQDITLRAISILKSVAVIAAEDTRHSNKLLKHFEISTPTLSCHNFNEEERTKKILSFLEEGKSVALISDAGTPLISDPGFHLIKKVKAEGISIQPIPGACAAIAALSVAALPTDKFSFIGFLPAKHEAMKQVLSNLIYEDKTLIFYVAPHRLMETLLLMKEVFGNNRLACIARELTKLFEDIETDTFENLLNYYQAHKEKQCGEVVVLVKGHDKTFEKNLIVANEVLKILIEELPVKQAANLASKITGKRKNELYEQALVISAKK